MSYSCYAIGREDEFQCSWWQWMPLWNYIAPRAKLNYADGLSNDFRLMWAEPMLEALTDSNAQKINRVWRKTGAENCTGKSSPLTFLSSDVNGYSVDDETLERFRDFLQRSGVYQIVIGG
jgi:hypothetical protein